MSDEMAWMTDLEAQVEAAVTEIERLRAENASLDEELAEVRQQLENAGAAGDDDGGEDEGREEWEAERAEVRKRVEGLVGKIEALLDG